MIVSKSGSQAALVQLAHGVARQRLEELDGTRCLEGGELGAARIGHVLISECHARLDDDERGNRLAL